MPERPQYQEDADYAVKHAIYETIAHAEGCGCAQCRQTEESAANWFLDQDQSNADTKEMLRVVREKIKQNRGR